MTGFASATGAHGAFRWSMDVRSVNGRGLDLRLRVPDWVNGLEAALRKSIGAIVTRGSVTLSLRLSREDEGGALVLNTDRLQSVLEAVRGIEAEAKERGVSLAHDSATDILSVKGVLEVSAAEDDTAELMALLLENAEPMLAAFDDMRRSEGRALAQILSDQLTEIETLVCKAGDLAAARLDETAANLRRNLERVLEAANEIDEQRVAQELAMIAVKMDVTEELDRTRAHVAAARELIGQGGPVGRKLDFLMQEFNREANTLCSKSQNTELTQIGLALKAAIDQMREQVQNVE